MPYKLRRALYGPRVVTTPRKYKPPGFKVIRVTLISATSNTTGTGSATNNLTIDIPSSGLQKGDLAIVWWSEVSGGLVTGYATPNGWTEVFAPQSINSGTQCIAQCYRYLETADFGTTFSFGTLSANRRQNISLTIYRNAKFDSNTSINASLTGTTTPPLDGIDPVANDCRIVAFAAVQHPAANTALITSEPATAPLYLEIHDFGTSVTAGVNHGSQEVQERQEWGGGSFGSTTFTTSHSSQYGTTTSAIAPAYFVNGVEETDISQTITEVKSRTLGQATETDIAQTITPEQSSPALGQAIETDTAQTLTRVKSKTLGIAEETDTSQAATRLKSKTLGQASETDTSQTLTRVKSKTLGQAVETDLARFVLQTIKQAVETDTAQSLTEVKSKTLGQNVENDTAQSITEVKSKTLGQATESDTSQSVTRRKSKTLGQAEETDIAQPITSGIPVLGQAVETDIAQSITEVKSRVLGQTTETDTAQSIVPKKFRSVGLASETDTAQPIQELKTRVLGLTTELDIAQTINRVKSRILGQSVETDTAFEITIFGVVERDFIFGPAELKWVFEDDFDDYNLETTARLVWRFSPMEHSFDYGELTP